MWLSLWRSRNRLSMDEFRYLVEQLQKIQFINEVNKDFLIEALRSISEIVTYGDQHDPTFFEFFMEKQVMAEFVRILKIPSNTSVALQLLQTLSILISNLKSDHAIYYMFSNGHINSLITYPFDFHNEELLSYYISFLRAISGKLDKNTISLLVKTHNDEVVSFPLYTEAIKFAFHKENMVRAAVRALTLTVYHVGDEYVNRYISGPDLSNYFSDFVSYFRNQCIKLDEWVSQVSKHPGSIRATSTVLSAVDQIEDNLYYFSDIISSGIPSLDKLITDNILQLLFFPLFLPSLKMKVIAETVIGSTTSLFLLCCILRIIKIKDLVSGIVAALFCPPELFIQKLETKANGDTCGLHIFHKKSMPKQEYFYGKEDIECLKDAMQNLSSSARIGPTETFFLCHNCAGRNLALREILLSYVVNGDGVQLLGSLSVLATLLQTKELDESILAALGILPRSSQHKKLLLEALVGESSGEEQLFSSGLSLMKHGISKVLDMHLKKLKDECGSSCSNCDLGMSPQKQYSQVLDALLGLLVDRSNISAETLWHAGWLLFKLLSCEKQEWNSEHQCLQDSYEKFSNNVLREVKNCWCDLLITVIIEEWKNCKKVIEASPPQKDVKCIIVPDQHHCSAEEDSSFFAGERMCKTVKVFILHHQFRIFSTEGD